MVAGPAKGLKLLFTGAAPVSGVQIDLSIGLGAQIYHAADALADETGGVIASEIDSLEGQNELGTARVERLEERLERERERLLERFIAMETALATMNRLLDSLRQQIDASFRRPAQLSLRHPGIGRSRNRDGRRSGAVPRRMRERSTMPTMRRAINAYGQASETWRRRNRSSCCTKARSDGSRRRARRSKLRRIADRCLAVRKATAIIEGLQSCLDHARGGEIARNLDRIYTHVIFRLQRINLTDDPAICDEVIARLDQLRAAWAQLAGGAPAAAERPARPPDQALAVTI